MYSSHIQCVANLCFHYLKPGDYVIDATCGNGHDSLRLAKIVLSRNFCHEAREKSPENETRLLVCDLQEAAIKATKQRLGNALSPQQLQYVRFHHGCHTEIFCQNKKPKLVIYNLGFLPGSSDKSLTSTCQNTLQSLQSAMAVLDQKGIICITAYPGHPEGYLETVMLSDFFKYLSKSEEWELWKYHSLSKEKAPCVFFLQRSDLKKKKEND